MKEEKQQILDNNRDNRNTEKESSHTEQRDTSNLTRSISAQTLYSMFVPVVEDIRTVIGELTEMFEASDRSDTHSWDKMHKEWGIHRYYLLNEKLASARQSIDLIDNKQSTLGRQMTRAFGEVIEAVQSIVDKWSNIDLKSWRTALDSDRAKERYREEMYRQGQVADARNELLLRAELSNDSREARTQWELVQHSVDTLDAFRDTIRSWEQIFLTWGNIADNLPTPKKPGMQKERAVIKGSLSKVGRFFEFPADFRSPSESAVRWLHQPSYSRHP